MQFTRPDPENPFRVLATITANEEVAEELLAELTHSEWGRRLVAIGDVPGFLVELTIDPGASTIFDAVESQLALEIWIDQTVDRVIRELYASS